MKKLIIIALLLSIASISAQPNKGNRQGSKFTPEQFAELRTKQMTLQLELTNSQQQRIKALLKEQATKRQEQREKFKAFRESGERPSSEQRYNMRLKRLDAQIAFQDMIKKVLNETQFETWKNYRANKMRNSKQRKEKRKMGKRINRGGRR